jgi:hypothetical protein
VKLRVAIGLLLAGAVVASVCRAQSYEPARLDDGRVDLQGVWNLSNLTPLERLAGFDSLVISREQASAIYFLVSPATVVTERFTRTADDELSYEFAVTDPT